MLRHLFAAIVCAVGLGSVTGCATTSHDFRPSSLGAPSRASSLLRVIDAPGPIEVETVVSTEWAITRAGLIDLSDPKAKAAHLVDGDEPIQVFFHVLRHPTRGVFLIDTGVERALRDDPRRAAMQGLVASEMHVEKMRFTKPLGDWLAEHPERVRGVFFTHLHLDHTSGAPDLRKATPLYAGPGEGGPRSFVNLFIQPNTDRALGGLPAVQEWRFQPDPDGRFEGVVDVFGDGSLWALWTPGHTPGSTSYVARTPKGPVLFTGDTCHTRWGWENDVPPGGFTVDVAKNRDSLARLRRLAKEHPAMVVRLGHQWMNAPGR